jgi:hypothetical protein
LHLLGNRELFEAVSCERLLVRYAELLARISHDPSNKL